MPLPENDHDEEPGLTLAAIRAWAMRWRRVPLIIGWMIYLVMSVTVGVIDGEAVLIPSQLVDVAATLDPAFLCIGGVCLSPVVLILGLSLPLVRQFHELPVGLACLLAALLGGSALTNIGIAVWTFLSAPLNAYILILWQSGLLLIAMSIAPWDALYVRQYGVLDCRACGYPLKPSIAAGSRSCPECGQDIPGVTFTAFDETVDREQRQAARAARRSQPPTDSPPPPTDH